MPTACITGITGQDGSYLAELLLTKGYTVYGLIRYTSLSSLSRIGHLQDNPRLHLVYGDILDLSSLCCMLQVAKPQEVYHLAALTHVQHSFEQPLSTAQATAFGTANVLEAVRLIHPECRVYIACSSEMYGNNGETIQYEEASCLPCSPYGAAKLYTYTLATTYRQSYQLFLSCGILFNHESPRRSSLFVTRKIALGVARIQAGLQRTLVLGNLDAQRDWGFAGDYVQAMWLMLQQDIPNDYVIATGKSWSVRDFVSAAFASVGIDHWQRYVEIDPSLFRPAEINTLIGDASKAHEHLSWFPETSFQMLVQMMVSSEIEQIKQSIC
jgi:GDPmannose 4,6-dehydratase